MRYEDLEIVLLSTAALFTFVTGFIIYFIFLYRNKQLKNERDQEQLRSAFQHELLKAQLEIQEQTLSEISREIHDNITQVLSFVKLNLAMCEKAGEDERREVIVDSREQISHVIADLRDLSKSLSFEHIRRMGLVKIIETEVARINKSKAVNAEIVVNGACFSLGEQRELVLFRIFQEGINNVLKNSNAKDLKIVLEYAADLFTFTLADNGRGFSSELAERGGGSGLRNIENRAALIGAHAEISSEAGAGCFVKVFLNPLQRTIFPNGSTDSTG